MAGNSWQQTASVFLIGLGVGAGLGVLLAPKSGEETRDDIVGAVNDGVDGVIAQGKKIGRRAQETVKQAREHVREVTEAGEQAYKEARTTSS